MASTVINATQIFLLLVQIFDNLTQAVAYKCDCIRQPLHVFWNILILAFIAISFLEIFAIDNHQT